MLFNKLKDIFQSLWVDCFFWLHKKPVETKIPDTKEDPKAKVEYPEPVHYEHGLNDTGFDLKPKEFGGFHDFTNSNRPINKLTKEEFETVLEEKRQALEDLLETNEQGDILMGRDPETNKGYYMKTSEIDHIKKVMYYNKKRK